MTSADAVRVRAGISRLREQAEAQMARHPNRSHDSDKGLCLYDGRPWPCPDYRTAWAVADLARLIDTIGGEAS